MLPGMPPRQVIVGYEHYRRHSGKNALCFFQEHPQHAEHVGFIMGRTEMGESKYLLAKKHYQVGEYANERKRSPTPEVETESDSEYAPAPAKSPKTEPAPPAKDAKEARVLDAIGISAEERRVCYVEVELGPGDQEKQIEAFMKAEFGYTSVASRHESHLMIFYEDDVGDDGYTFSVKGGDKIPGEAICLAYEDGEYTSLECNVNEVEAMLKFHRGEYTF